MANGGIYREAAEQFPAQTKQMNHELTKDSSCARVRVLCHVRDCVYPHARADWLMGNDTILWGPRRELVQSADKVDYDTYGRGWVVNRKLNLEGGAEMVNVS